MRSFPLHPFLLTVSHDLHLTVADYDRIRIALQTGGPWTRAQLRDMLLSLLVKDPEYRDRFIRQFDAFFIKGQQADLSDAEIQKVIDRLKALVSKPTLIPSDDDIIITEPAEPEKPERKYLLGSVLTVGLLLILLAVKIIFFPAPPPPIPKPDDPDGIIKPTLSTTPTPPPKDEKEEEVLFIDKTETTPIDIPKTLPLFAKKCLATVTGLILILCGYVYYLWQSRKIPEDKKPAWNEHGSRMFSMGQIGGNPAPLIDDAALDQIADSLGYFQSALSGRRPDIDASVKASVKCGGMPEIIFKKRKQIRSLLILEDRFAADRVWNTAAAELAAGMSKRGIPVIHGYFDSTPALFRTPDRGILRLEDLEDHRRGYLLLIFTDGKWAYGTQKKFILEQLARWPMIAWMDLREPRLWDASAAVPVRYHIPVYPASPDGIVKAVRLFLTEQASAGDFSAKASQARGLPPLLSDRPDRHIEYLLGDALGWAQDCAMIQPLSPGLADALRKQYHSHLPGQRIGRLYALPGTICNTSGLQFTDEVLRVLRIGFMQHRDPSEQKSVLKFILEKIEAAKPTDKTADETAPAFRMWELAQERIKMELDAKDHFEHLAQLAAGELGNYIRAELEPYGFEDDTAKIPLRLKKPQNQKALQRLARINTDFGIKKLEKYPVGAFHRAALKCLVVLSITFSVLSLQNYLDQPFKNLEIIGLENDHALLEIKTKDQWKTERQGDYQTLTVEPLQPDRTYRLSLIGKGYFATKKFEVSAERQTLIHIGRRLEQIEWEELHTQMEFVKIPKGCFMMGSPDDEKGRYKDEGPVHQVCLTKDFWMGKYEVSNAQYRRFNSEHNSGKYGKEEKLDLNKDDQPVVRVSWDDAQKFIKWLNAQHKGKYKFRLPTEAEWEYACRAGTATARYWGDNPDEACKYANVADEEAKKVFKDWTVHKCNDNFVVAAPLTKFEYDEKFKPNRFGLYHMLGNVWEWCEDYYAEDAYDKLKGIDNPIYDSIYTQDSGAHRVIRGGSWDDRPASVRCANRSNDPPDNRFDYLGVRLVRTVTF